LVKVICTESVEVTKVADALTGPSATLAPAGVVKVTVFAQANEKKLIPAKTVHANSVFLLKELANL